jgi:putative methionine-R-sulfoxide reductase with GAF domain
VKSQPSKIVADAQGPAGTAVEVRATRGRRPDRRGTAGPVIGEVSADRRFVAQLMDVSALLQHQQSLEEGLHDLAGLAARSLEVDRCSVMLLIDEGEDRMLKVFSHHGDVPKDAYAETIPLDGSVAGFVASTGEPLLIDDIARSPLAHLARHGEGTVPSLMSVPIRVGESIVGVINASAPRGRLVFGERDLDLLSVFALFVGTSIQVFQLQRLAESRLLQMAQLLDRRENGAGAAPICPDPGRLAKLVAKNFYRELAAAGFGPSAIISVSSQVLSELNENLGRHRSRLERQQAAAPGPEKPRT